MAGTAKIIQLRGKSGGTFDTDNNIIFPQTHINAVLGLVDSNTSKINLSLLPSAIIETKKLAGAINNSMTLQQVYDAIVAFHTVGATPYPALYPGSYLISNGVNAITASANHRILYGDDGSGYVTSTSLNHGDHLFYLRFGSGFYWNSVVGPHAANVSNRYYATIAEMNSDVQTASGVKGIIAGFDIEPTTITTYTLTVTTPELPGKQDIFYSVHSQQSTFWNAVQENTVIRVNTGLGYEYWKVVTSPDARAYYESTAFTNTHLWGVLNNTYDLATVTTPGLMSPADKSKLDTLQNYVHPFYTVRDIDTTNIEVLSTFDSDSTGHVTNITKRTLPTASQSAKGVVEIATAAEAQAGNSDDYVLSPLSGKALVDYHQDVSGVFADLNAANTATLPNGAVALIQVGTVVIP